MACIHVVTHIIHCIHNYAVPAKIFYYVHVPIFRCIMYWRIPILEAINRKIQLVDFNVQTSFEPRREKTGLRGFRPGPTQTGLYSLRSRLEA